MDENISGSNYKGTLYFSDGLSSVYCVDFNDDYTGCFISSNGYVDDFYWGWDNSFNGVIKVQFTDNTYACFEVYEAKHGHLYAYFFDNYYNFLDYNKEWNRGSSPDREDYGGYYVKLGQIN